MIWMTYLLPSDLPWGCRGKGIKIPESLDKNQWHLSGAFPLQRKQSSCWIIILGGEVAEIILSKMMAYQNQRDGEGEPIVRVHSAVLNKDLKISYPEGKGLFILLFSAITLFNMRHSRLQKIPITAWKMRPNTKSKILKSLLRPKQV